MNKTVYILRTIIGGELHGKILILSVSDNEEHILEKILKAVEGSADIEDRTLPSEKIELADLQILLPEKIVYRNGKEILLNRHEFDVLVYLASHPGWVRSKEQIYFLEISLLKYTLIHHFPFFLIQKVHCLYQPLVFHFIPLWINSLCFV